MKILSISLKKIVLGISFLISILLLNALGVEAAEIDFTELRGNAIVTEYDNGVSTYINPLKGEYEVYIPQLVDIPYKLKNSEEVKKLIVIYDECSSLLPRKEIIAQDSIEKNSDKIIINYSNGSYCVIDTTNNAYCFIPAECGDYKIEFNTIEELNHAIQVYSNSKYLGLK